MFKQVQPVPEPEMAEKKPNTEPDYGPQPAYIYKFFGESAKDSECTSATDCDALYGIVSLSKTWNKGVLKVYFMNEAVLRGWRCGSNAMTTKKILAWAKGAWNNQSLQGVPKFVETRSEDKDDQDIRVYFTDKEGEGCWSMVGTDALKTIVKGEVTMQLNLRGHSKSHQKSLVIHEFGHALGLEHEHERSDFWAVAMDLVDKEKIKKDPRVRSSLGNDFATFEKKWGRMVEQKKVLLKKKKQVMLNYDPDSIMHYWLDVEWLREDGHKDYQYVVQNPDGALTKLQQKCLMGFHRRSWRKQLSYAPSRGDVKALVEAYRLQSGSTCYDTQSKRVVPFFSKLFLWHNYVQDSSNHKVQVASAFVSRNKIWLGRQRLRVYFLNEEFIDGWRCGPDQLTVTAIMAWAKVWNSPGFDEIPELVWEERHRRADIRVQFTNDEGCWSMVGTEACRISPDKPTMVLSLRGYSPSLQRSLVIHQFGHALGLEHEHQRSDFWDVVGDCFDKDKMMKDPRVSMGQSMGEHRASFGRDWFKKFESDSSFTTEYDPDSIMHYRFDVRWLKEDFQDPDKIEGMDDLSEMKKKYLKGIHNRAHENPLSKNPSKLDLLALGKAYGSSEEQLVKPIDVIRKEQQKYSKALNELMTNKKAISLCYLKTYFIGSSGVGKSTTRKRLTKEIKINLASLSEEDRKRHSTFLAECTQVLAIMDPSESKLTLQVCSNADDETRSLVTYLYTSKLIEPDTTTLTHHDSSRQLSGAVQLPTSDQPSAKHPSATEGMPTRLGPMNTDNPSASQAIQVGGKKIADIINALHSIAASSKHDKSLYHKILLNMVDIGGQPGFLEMFPFLSHGPGIFLAFFRLDKDLDEPCVVSYEREGQKILPYDTIYTFRETLSQILSSINHYVTFDKAVDPEHLKKLGIDYASVKPVATLVGTFKDELQTKIAAQVLREKLSAEFTQVSESDREEVIEYVLEQANSTAPKHEKISAKANEVMLSRVDQWQASEPFKTEVEDRLEKELEKKDKAISTLANRFEDVLVDRGDSKHFLALDNFKGTDDIDPLQKHLQKMLVSFSKENNIKILPSQLLLGVVLRKEYDIISMDDCILIGKVGLQIEKEEVEFAIFYLSRWVGALIYHPEIKDKWFQDNIICSPQVIFDSISSLIVKPLLELHSKDSTCGFVSAERTNWIEKGQFSLDTMKRCISKKYEEEVRNHKLIPVEKLLKLLKHSNLLSEITTKGSKETMCFIPAILESASPIELTKSPPPDADTPSPIKITFKTGYVPIGLFCAVISRLASKGNEGILGIKWQLVELGAKRNLISFRVDSVAKHMVTLIAHVDCYEVRVIRQDRDFTLYGLCSYVLSTLLYVMMAINDSIHPIMAFDCQCSRHQPQSSFQQLCQLTPGVYTSFTCNGCKVPLTADQECWFAKEVKLGDDVTLKALPFADSDKTLSFKWIKPGKKTLKCSENELDMNKKVTQDHFKGFYECEIIKNNESFFSVYHSFKEAKPCDPSVSDKDKLLDDVESATKEIRAKWYSMAIELDIDHGTRKFIASHFSNHPDIIDVCFREMLRRWVNRISPPPSISALIGALESLAINRGGIIERVKEAKLEIQAETGKSLTPSLRDLHRQSQLSVDTHLKQLRTALWEMRADWNDLAVQLEVSAGTRDAIKVQFRENPDHCLTNLLERWLTKTPPPILDHLINALTSSNNECTKGIARDMEAMLTQSAPPPTHTQVQSALPPQGDVKITNTDGGKETQSYPMCGSAPMVPSMEVDPSLQPGAAAPHISKGKVWKGRKLLKVYFMNPDDIDDWGWKCRGEPMNINTIFAWARVWNFVGFKEIPTFEFVEIASQADIRVKFSSCDTDNWSMVGIKAESVTKVTEPTMMLHLGGHLPDLQQSLVVHEFGHALGLEHEHQSSKFWDVLEKHLDVEEMEKDPKVAAAFADQWAKKDNGEESVNDLSEYDPDSIMHYRFDIKWIANKALQTYENIDKDLKLKEKEKKYLKALHKRSQEGQLPKQPTLNDYKVLAKAYNIGDTFDENSEEGRKLQVHIQKPPEPSPVVGSKDRVLEVNTHLKAIKNTVWPMRAYWRNLGVELLITSGTLDAIDVDERVSGNKLGAVLEKWMYTGRATINDLISGLRSVSVLRGDLADEILKHKNKPDAAQFGFK